MKKVNYALVGFGGIAENRLAREGFACDRGRFAPLAEACLVGATDVNPARQAAAAALGIKWYADLEAVLADPAVDAVFVATNNLTHAAVASRALEAGRHVLVEKPMATDATAAEALCRLAAAKGLSLGVDHMMIENAYNRRAAELVAGGALGTVNDSRFHMEFLFGSTPEEAASWRCARRAEMGGPIGDVASHCLYVAEFIFASPVAALACAYHPRTLEISTEDGAFLRFRLASGLTGSAQVSFADPRGGLHGTLSNLGYEIYGDQAVLRGFGTMFQMSGHPGEPLPVRLELDRFSAQDRVEVGPVENIYRQVVRKHAASILANRPMNGHDGWHSLKLIAAAHASAQAGGAWQKIN